MLSKLFDKIKSYQYHIFLAVCIGLISFISYNLGQISSNDKKPLKMTENANIYSAVEGQEAIAGETEVSSIPTKILDMRVVVSKASDSKKYHYSWCNTWKRIKLENQLWFSSDKEAEANGYTLAGNCTR